MQEANERRLIVNEDAKSPISEAFRTLRTNLHFAKADGQMKTLLFTSTGPREGKSTVTANTAVALAQAGRSVILVDCDLRKPVQHRTFGRKQQGVTNILVEELDPLTVVQDTDIENLRLLTSGPIPPNPSELLGSKRMTDLLKVLTQNADIVIVDAPPTIAVTDASVLASQVDGIVLVVSAGIPKPEMAQQARDLLIRAQGNLLGVVLNRIEMETGHYYYYYYYGEEKGKRH